MWSRVRGPVVSPEAPQQISAPNRYLKCPLPAVSTRQQLHTVVNQPQEANRVTHPSQANRLEVRFSYEIDICSFMCCFQGRFHI